jgi:hypothetical protein
MAPINSWEPCYSAKIPNDLQTYNLDVLWLQEEEEKDEGFPVKELSIKVAFIKSLAERCLHH